MLAIMQYHIIHKVNDKNKGNLPVTKGPFTGWDPALHWKLQDNLSKYVKTNEFEPLIEKGEWGSSL